MSSSTNSRATSSTRATPDRGIDSPVGLAFRTHLPPGETLATVPGRLDWFRQFPDEMHDEQREFLQAHSLAG